MRTNRHDEANSRFSHICERACKLETLPSDFASLVGQTPACSSRVMQHQNRHTTSDSKITQSRTEAPFSPTASLRRFIPINITPPSLQTNITAT